MDLLRNLRIAILGLLVGAGVGLFLAPNLPSSSRPPQTTATTQSRSNTNEQSQKVTERVVVRYAPAPPAPVGQPVIVGTPQVVEVVKEVIREVEAKESTSTSDIKTTATFRSTEKAAYALGVVVAWDSPKDLAKGLGLTKWTITPETRIGRSNLFVGVPIVVNPSNLGLPGVGLSVRMEF